MHAAVPRLRSQILWAKKNAYRLTRAEVSGRQPQGGVVAIMTGICFMPRGGAKQT
jgi:hypothetical protein